MGKSKVSIRGTRKSTIKQGYKIEFSASEVKEIADILLASVHREILKDIAKTSGIKGGGPVPIPDSKSFVDSFKVRISGNMIEIYSDWPTADAHLNKQDKGPFPMTWLSRPDLSYARITTQDGLSLVRSTPSSPNFWVHPGFKKYSFLERGVRKGQEEAYEKIGRPKVISSLQKQGFFNTFRGTK